MQRHILFVLMSMVVLSPMAVDIYLSSTAKMAIDLQASRSQIQSILSIYFFALGFGQLVMGPICDRFGRKPVVVFGLLLYLFSALAIAFVDSILSVQFLRFLQGFAACAICVVLFSVVRDVYSYERSSKIYSYLNGVLSVIPALAPILGSILAMYYGWQATFVFMALYALLVLLIVFKFLPETLSAKSKEQSYALKLYSLERFFSVYSNPVFVFYSLCCMAALAGILSYVSYAPLWLIQHLEVSELVFSLLFGLNAITSIICCFLAPRWIERFGNKLLVKLGLSLMIGAALLMLLLEMFSFSGLSGALAFMLPVSLLSMGLSLMIGPASGMALAAFADSAGTAAALLGFIQMVGASIIITIVQQTGLLAPFAVSLIVLLLVVPLLFVICSKKLSVLHDLKGGC